MVRLMLNMNSSVSFVVFEKKESGISLMSLRENVRYDRETRSSSRPRGSDVRAKETQYKDSRAVRFLNTWGVKEVTGLTLRDRALSDLSDENKPSWNAVISLRWMEKVSREMRSLNIPVGKDVMALL